MPSKVLDIDLANGPPEDIEGLTSYDKAFVLLRWHGRPIGRVLANLSDGRIAGTDLLRAASLELGKRLVLASLEDLRQAPENGKTESSLPSCSVVVCTRDRVEDLKKCIEALCVSKSKNNVEIIIVDNAPPDDGTAKLAAKYPVRYVCEERQGLNWARRRGALEALNEVVIYTDDDVTVDPLWIDEMRRPFIDPGISAVTGLILPTELETLAQEYFEHYFSFCLGFERNEFKVPDVMAVMNGDVGVGASMAIRRSIINGLKLFDFEMDCGTIARSGGDTHAFYLLLSRGCRILYNPEAVCWHRHRREIYELERTLFGYGTGFFVHLIRCLLQHGEMESFYAAYFIYKYWLEKLWKGLRGDPLETPPSIMIQFIKGSLHAPWAYIISRHRERAYLCGSGAVKAEGFCGSKD